MGWTPQSHQQLGVIYRPPVLICSQRTRIPASSVSWEQVIVQNPNIDSGSISGGQVTESVQHNGFRLIHTVLCNT